MVDFGGQLNQADVVKLSDIANNYIKDNMLIAEVGSWKGHSSSILGERAKITNSIIFCIDHWKGTPKTNLEQEAIDKDIFNAFKSNMIELGVFDNICPIKMSSIDASRIFANEIFDIIFIDADHSYNYFLQDIIHWLPKLKNNGVICGHDAQRKYSDLSDSEKKLVDNNLNCDFNNEYQGHPGISRVLYDYFEDKHEILYPSWIWIIRDKEILNIAVRKIKKTTIE